MMQLRCDDHKNATDMLFVVKLSAFPKNKGNYVSYYDPFFDMIA